MMMMDFLLLLLSFHVPILRKSHAHGSMSCFGKRMERNEITNAEEEDSCLFILRRFSQRLSPWFLNGSLCFLLRLRLPYACHNWGTSSQEHDVKEKRFACFFLFLLSRIFRFRFLSSVALFNLKQISASLLTSGSA